MTDDSEHQHANAFVNRGTANLLCVIDCVTFDDQTNGKTDGSLGDATGALDTCGATGDHATCVSSAAAETIVACAVNDSWISSGEIYDLWRSCWNASWTSLWTCG